MKIFVNHFEKSSFESKLQHLKNLDFTLFIDDIPKSSDNLSPINILVLQEPNEYFGLHDWAIQNKDLFQVILTWDDKVLNNCENALLLPFGHTWLKPDQYEKEHEKKFEISHLCGVLNKSYGHSMRHEILARENEFKMSINFHKTIGDRHNIEDARIGKEIVFGNSMFGVVIENFSHRGYFSEKILDCFLLKTIPIYWGCSNIIDYFDPAGIIGFKNVDDLIYICNNLDEFQYEYSKNTIEKNYQKALQYVNYEQNIVDKITEVFKLNNLI
jgi:hypothetical protein